MTTTAENPADSLGGWNPPDATELEPKPAMPDPATRKAEARDFLERLTAGAQGVVMVGSVAAPTPYALSDPAWLDRAASQAASMQGNAYVTVSTLHERPRTGRGKSADALAVLTVSADVDVCGPTHAETALPPTIDDAAGLIASLGIEPTYIIHTGGGLQPHWILTGGEQDTERARKTIVRLQGALRAKASARGWKVDSTPDLVRQMRLPGTINAKIEGQPLPVAVHQNGGPTWEIAALEAMLPDVVEEAPSPAPRKPLADGEVMTQGRENWLRDRVWQLHRAGFGEAAMVAALDAEAGPMMGGLDVRLSNGSTVRDEIRKKAAYAARKPVEGATVLRDATWRALGSDDEAPREVPDFPIHLLPDGMRELVQLKAEQMRRPYAFTALPAIVSAAAAIGSTRRIEVKPTWTEPAIVWAALVAEPSTGKSPAAEPFVDVLLQRHRELGDRHRARLAARAEKAKKDQGAAPIRSVQAAGGLTVPGLYLHLPVSPRGILVWPDEIAKLINGWGEYQGGSSSERASFLALWSQKALSNLRVTDQPDLPDNAVVNVYGGIQPEHKAFREMVTSTDGLPQRFLFGFYPNLLGQHEAPEDPRVAEAKRAWDERIRDLLALGWLHAPGGQIPYTYKLSPDASREWTRRYNLNVDAGNAQERPQVRQIYGKFPAQAARLALVLQCFDRPTSDAWDMEVSVEWMARAWDIIDTFFAPHGTEALGGAGVGDATHPVVAWARDHGGVVSLEDLTRLGPYAYRKGMRETVAHLVSRGILVEKIIPRPKGRGGSAKTVIEVVRA